MGEVYRAVDTRLGRDVAIKVLPESFAADAERLARFAQEAKAVAALNHPNILAVFDIGEHDKTPYIVSELLEGETLRSRLAEGEVLRLLLFLTVDANAGPWDGVQAGTSDPVFTVHADAVSSLVEAMDGFLDRAKDFRVGLFQSQLYVDVAFLGGLINPVAALRTRLSGRRPRGNRGEKFVAFPFEDFPVFLKLRRLHSWRCSCQ